MPSAYIYMECPITGETVTLGKLTLGGGVGTFRYAPEAVEGKCWVPDPIRFPLSARPITVRKNGGVPGFIMRSVVTDRYGYPVAAGTSATWCSTSTAMPWMTAPTVDARFRPPQPGRSG